LHPLFKISFKKGCDQVTINHTDYPLFGKTDGYIYWSKFPSVNHTESISGPIFYHGRLAHPVLIGLKPYRRPRTITSLLNASREFRQDAWQRVDEQSLNEADLH
jgi:hypothetical protein